MRFGNVEVAPARDSPVDVAWTVAAPIARVYPLVRTAVVVGIASADALGGSAFVVYALAVAASIAGAAFAPAQSALMPSLAETPEELTSANVAMSTTASIGMFAGPALAGALLAVGSTSLVFAITAASFVWSALCVAGIPLDPAPAAEGGPEPGDPPLGAEPTSYARPSLSMSSSSRPK